MPDTHRQKPKEVGPASFFFNHLRVLSLTGQVTGRIQGASPGLERDGPDHHLMVEGGERCTDEWSHPENPVVVPATVFVEDDGRAEAPGRVDAGPGDGDRGQVHQEHREPDWQRGQNRDVRVSGAPLSVGGGEDGVNEHEGTDDLGAEAVAFGVARVDEVGAPVQPLERASLFEPFHHAGPAYGAQALHHHVVDGPRQGQLPTQEQPERHRWVYVTTRDTGGAIDESEDHASEGPSDALNSDRRALGRGFHYAHHGQDGDVQEQERGHELGDPRPVEGPRRQLRGLKERRRRGFGIVPPVLALGRCPNRLPLRELVGSLPSLFP